MSSVSFSAQTSTQKALGPAILIMHTSSCVVDDGVCHAGADFVDVSLGIIVCSAADTIMAFHPHHHHGTTLCNHVRHTVIAFTFSRQIVQAFQESSKCPGYIPCPVFTWECTDVCQQESESGKEDPMDDENMEIDCIQEVDNPSYLIENSI